ncbi:MAG: dTDP-4-dehydrorhamnose reductase [Alphaproteobacteria bacterium]|nr:dTDP-4-dehydrorhamnose reductase [Alphaproteobacteria bacterium]
MKNILITGANGQLGTELGALLPDAIKTDRNELDITNADAVNRFVDKNKIDSIINCAAYTAVDRAEDDIQMAEKINAIGPRNLAASGAKIIHISTDYVFDGTAHRPYSALDLPNPVSVYGKTKLSGEFAVRNFAKIYAIIRTAWLYSPYGSNFVKTMLRLGHEKTEINVVADQIGTPTYAADLARAIVKILPLLNEKNSGIYHYTNNGVCSWYDFATEIMTMSGLKCRVNPIKTEQYPTRATRPAYSVLDKSKIKEVFDVDIPHWRVSLEKCLGAIKNNER